MNRPLPMMLRPSIVPVLLSLLLGVSSSAAQRLVVSDLDTTGFPVVRARVYLLDTLGRPLSGIGARDVVVTEGGIVREGVSVSCPNSPADGSISSVLTIDVSGSMAQTVPGSRVPNMGLAKSAARAWINALPPSGFECAVTTFDDRGLVISDFTSDRARLLSAVDVLFPQGGTNYNAGLVVPPAGGISVVDSGKFNRVVIFLTDGQGRADEEKIVAAAAKARAAVYCVTIGMPAPEVLKRIARRTGGEWFEQVTTVGQAEAIYRAILYRARGGEPCEITWTSAPACDQDRFAVISVPAVGGSHTVFYKAPAAATPRLEMSVPSVEFGPVPPGATREMKVVLTARNRPVTVSSIAPAGASISDVITLSGAEAPFTLADGESRTLTVRYAPVDSAYSFARWRIAGDACSGGILFADGGSRVRREPRITLLRPNGGERFQAGEETTITWEGVPTSDTVTLEYSTNSGASWRTVASKATGGRYRWLVPATPSEVCLARVSQSERSTATAQAPMKLAGHGDYILTTAFNQTGTRLFSASWDGTAKIWDAESGRTVRTLSPPAPGGSGRPARVHYIEASPDGGYVATSVDGNRTQIWSAGPGRMIMELAGRPFNKTDVTRLITEGDVTPDGIFSRDGRRILLQSDEVPTVWDAVTGRRTAQMRGHGERVNSALFTPDGRRVVTASDDGTARVWDAATGSELFSFRHPGGVSGVAVSSDGLYAATVAERDSVTILDIARGVGLRKIGVGRRSDGTQLRVLFSPDGETILVWAGVDVRPTLYDFRTGRELRILQEYTPDGRPDAHGSVGYAMFSPDGRRVATISGASRIHLWNAEDGRKVGEFSFDSQMSHAAFSPDGRRISAGLGDTLVVWNVEAPLAQEDRSDSLWAIVDSHPAAIDVDFGRRVVGSVVDSVIVGLIRNDGTAPMRVARITIAGAHASDFDLVSGMPPYDIPAKGEHPVELRFSPRGMGARAATLRIDAGGRTLTPAVRGEGVRPMLRMETAVVDFGRVAVGSSRDTIVEVMLSNVGSVPVTVTGRLSGPDTLAFEMPGGGATVTLAPNERRSVGLTFRPERGGRTSARVVFTHDGPGSPEIGYLYGEGVEGPRAERYTDPTTFRTIASPNAILPPKGRIILGTYDALGLVAGYGITDNVMILAGGALPLPDDWGGPSGSMYGAYSLGVKGGMSLGRGWNIAAGYQWARSIYDREETGDETESAIGVHAPYGALSHGDDDSRISATFGYAFKRHVTNGIGGTFDRNALIVAFGGDYRFAERWKVSLEAVTMQTLGYLPVAVAARYFGRNYAIEGGLGYLGITTGGEPAPSLPVAPVVSYIHVF